MESANLPIHHHTALPVQFLHTRMGFSSFPIQQAVCCIMLCHAMSPESPSDSGRPWPWRSIQLIATIESRQQMLEGHSKRAQTQWPCCHKEQPLSQLRD